jgi:hypothetical protein
LTIILLDIGENSKVAADPHSFHGGLQQSKYDYFWKFADLFVEGYKATHDRRHSASGSPDLGFFPMQHRLRPSFHQLLRKFLTMKFNWLLFQVLNGTL